MVCSPAVPMVKREICRSILTSIETNPENPSKSPINIDVEMNRFIQTPIRRQIYLLIVRFGIFARLPVGRANAALNVNSMFDAIVDQQERISFNALVVERH
jgi:hypothetical protein